MGFHTKYVFYQGMGVDFRLYNVYLRVIFNLKLCFRDAVIIAVDVSGPTYGLKRLGC